MGGDRLCKPLKSQSKWLNAVSKRLLRALVIGIVYASLAVPLIIRAFNSPVRGLKHPSTLVTEGEDVVIVYVHPDYGKVQFN